MVMREIAADAANQELVKENQLKEIDRLKAALRNLKKHGQFTSEQISEFNRYLDDTRKKASTNSLIGAKPFKYTYKALEKKGIIVDSTVPPFSIGKTKFFISMVDAGLFSIEAKVAGVRMVVFDIELEELLEMKDHNQIEFETEHATLSVVNMLALLNKKFLS